jgi:hypothetical protein
MKKSFLYAFLILALGCSPYKKVVVSKTDQLTNRWKGQPEENVRKVMGSYRSKSRLPDGYLIRYDYSYLLPAAVSKSDNFQVRATTQSNIMTPAPTHEEHASPDDSVIRRMDFYFDNTRHVQYVQATGFPDSVYLVKRK